MALLFIDGFDHYTTADLNSKWIILGGGGTIQTTGSRTGSGSLQITSASNGFCKEFSQISSAIAGFAMKPDSLTRNSSFCSFRFDSLSPHITFALTASGTIRVSRGLYSGTALGTSTTALVSSVWSFIEVKVVFHSSAGSVNVRVDGADVLSLANVNTLANTSFPGTTQFVLGYDGSGSSRTIQYDDLYLCDASGTQNNDFLGDVKVTTLSPSANGSSSGMAPSAGTDHAALVDDATPDISDYVSSNVVGATYSWAYGDIAGLPAVKGVQINTYAAKGDAGIRTYSPIARLGGTIYEGTQVYTSTSPQYGRHVFETNPATSSEWSGSDVNNAEFGVKVKM